MAQPKGPDWFDSLTALAERAERSLPVRLVRSFVPVLVIGFAYVVVSLALTMPFALAWLFQ